MTEDSARAGPTMAELEAVLLDAKLSVPQRQAGSVSHADLIEAARRGECRVVGVTAPAGYGKSTLLAEWAEREDRRVAWVTLDRLDDDPSALLFLLASAFAPISGHPDLIADTGGPGASALGRAAPRLASAFRTSPAPFVLIIDDLHELRSPACHDVLGVVMSGIPEGSQLVAASRSEQPLLPRLRALGDAVEITAGDLALDAAGAEQIFAEAQVAITHEQAAEVTARTEGWPVGLHLAALIAGDSPGDGLRIAGDDRYVADYLYQESLMKQPASVQRFLRRTAVLDQLSAPLCDATLQESGAAARLRDLEASSMFLVPLDRRRGWYRYHALFREFLLAELHRVEPETVAKLHLRAADWYESNGSPALALEHLLSTNERDRCVQLMTQLILPTFQAGQLSTVQRWLSTLGPSAIGQHPPLAVLAGWIAVLTGETADAQRWAAFLDTASYDQAPVDGTASFDSARAMLRALMCAAGPEQMALDASIATAAEPPWSPWRALALIVSAEAQLLLSHHDRAAALLTETSAVASTLGNVGSIVVSRSELALMAMDQRHWAEAAEHVEVALATIENSRLHD
ncbi:MAG TPA: AAA family ATPase, partial [Propionibacteriaceae bacterium]|nr:AAA family ATPase [Propionibacteriaceae bacterium]